MFLIINHNLKSCYKALLECPRNKREENCVTYVYITGTWQDFIEYVVTNEKCSGARNCTMGAWKDWNKYYTEKKSEGNQKEVFQHVKMASKTKLWKEGIRQFQMEITA